MANEVKEINEGKIHSNTKVQIEVSKMIKELRKWRKEVQIHFIMVQQSSYVYYPESHNQVRVSLSSKL